MKKYFFILITVVLLSACSNSLEVHDDVYNDLATDSLQVFEILEDAADDQVEVSDPDQKIINTYLEKYGRQYESHLLEGINSSIYVTTELTIELLIDDTTLASSKSSIKSNKENVIYSIENGESK